MKTDYEKIIDFCEAEIESPQSEMFIVDEYANFYTISLPLPESSITIYKPSRALAFDANRVSFGDGCQTAYSDLPIWERVAHMLGLKSAWIACADRLPELDGDYLVYFKNGGISQASFVGGKWSITIQYQNINRTHDAEVSHWQPLPTKP